MIHVNRGNAPDGFDADAHDWLTEFHQVRQTTPTMTADKFWAKVRERKAMKNYAQFLHSVFHHKCAFCESQMEHVSPAHIEHYRPKSNDQFQDLMFYWGNWLLACPNCNSHKHARFDFCDGQPCLLDPTTDDPAEHLAFLEVQLLSITERGQKTIKQIQLNRVQLLEMRRLWLEYIKKSLLLLVLAPDPVKKEIREALIWAMQDNAPYAAMTRAYLAEKTPKLANPTIPYAFIENVPIERIEELLEAYDELLQRAM